MKKVHASLLLGTLGAGGLFLACSSIEKKPAITDPYLSDGGPAPDVTQGAPRDANTEQPPPPVRDSGTEAEAGPVQCANNQQDPGETDVDCGGTLCGKCIDGKKCISPTDCVGGFCDPQLLTCKTPTCNDNQLNGKETAVDCGGGTCARCTVGRKCTANTDCQSGLCGGSGNCECPGGMVVIPTNQALGGAYCMEQTEVTQGEYNQFVVANQPVRFQPAGCDEVVDGGTPRNSTYVPSGDWPPANLNLPVHYVDWCDAFAYCKWKGRQLCGNVKGGPNPQAQANSIANSAWFNACAAQGQNTYPYAGGFSVSACNGGTDAGPDAAALVTNIPVGMCQGGFVGLYQMSGNVAEWEDSCPQAGTDAGPIPTPGDLCLVRGGSYLSEADASALACAASRSVQRIPSANSDLTDIGFRCCVY